MKLIFTGKAGEEIRSEPLVQKKSRLFSNSSPAPIILTKEQKQKIAIAVVDALMEKGGGHLYDYRRQDALSQAMKALRRVNL